MTSALARRLACAALVTVLAVSGRARPPSTGLDDSSAATLKGATSPRTMGDRTHTTRPVETNPGPHRFMLPGNLYYNQIDPFAGGGMMLAVFWKDFDTPPQGDHPMQSVEDGYRQVSIEPAVGGWCGGCGLSGAGFGGACDADAALGADACAVDCSWVPDDVREVTPDW